MYISEAWWYHCLLLQWYQYQEYIYSCQYTENQVTHCKVSDALLNWFLLTMYACIVPHHVIQYSFVSMRLILINRHSSVILPIFMSIKEQRRWGLSLSDLGSITIIIAITGQLQLQWCNCNCNCATCVVIVQLFL